MTRVLTAPLRLLWGVTGKPIHQRLFGRYFQATISRLNSTLGELSAVRAEIEEARSEISACRTQQQELGRQMRALTSGYWDTAALSRRLTTIEDRVYVSAKPSDPTPVEHAETRLESDSPAETKPSAAS